MLLAPHATETGISFGLMGRLGSDIPTLPSSSNDIHIGKFFLRNHLRLRMAVEHRRLTEIVLLKPF